MCAAKPASCLDRNRHNKVRPSSTGTSCGVQEEIRPGRVLHIKHINARLRDPKFQQEMEMQKHSRSQGIVFAGPLTMPRQRNQARHSRSENNMPSGSAELISDMMTKSNCESGTADFLQGNNVHTLDEHIPCTQADNSIADINKTVSKPTVVLFFIHGVGGSSDVWQAQMGFFARIGFEIVSPDLIGHGMSSTPREAKAYHFREIMADLLEIFDQYCKRQNIVIGHSYGCSFAAVLGRLRSRRVQKLVMISGGSPIPLAPKPGIFSLPTCLLNCFRPCLNHKFHKSAFHPQRQPVWDKDEAFSIPTYVLQHTMNGQQWPDGDEMFHRWLMCPVLLIYGAHDKLVSMKEEQLMADTLFYSRFEVIPDASHMVMIEAPKEVNSLLLHFFHEDSTYIEPVISSSRRSSIHQHEMSEMPQRSASRMSTKSYKAMPDGHLTVT